MSLSVAKYITKYTHKGPDRATVELQQRNVGKIMGHLTHVGHGHGWSRVRVRVKNFPSARCPYPRGGLSTPATGDFFLRH